MNKYLKGEAFHQGANSKATYFKSKDSIQQNLCSIFAYDQNHL